MTAEPWVQCSRPPLELPAVSPCRQGRDIQPVPSLLPASSTFPARGCPGGISMNGAAGLKGSTGRGGILQHSWSLQSLTKSHKNPKQRAGRSPLGHRGLAEAPRLGTALLAAHTEEPASAPAQGHRHGAVFSTSSAGTRRATVIHRYITRNSRNLSSRHPLFFLKPSLRVGRKRGHHHWAFRRESGMGAE